MLPMSLMLHFSLFFCLHRSLFVVILILIKNDCDVYHSLLDSVVVHYIFPLTIHLALPRSAPSGLITIGKTSAVMKEETGLATSLEDEEITRYTKEVLQEVMKKRTRK